jgi:hypothetical protein
LPTYNKTAWINGSAPAVSANNLNKIEAGIDLATTITGQTSATTASWTATTDAGFAVKKNISIAGVTSTMRVDVLFIPQSFAGAQDANVGYATTYDGGITLYADNTPSETLFFDYTVVKTIQTTNVPSTLTTTLWLDASDLNTITLVSTGVSEWRDKSGNGRHASQATAASRPTYTSNKITFDGTNDVLRINEAFLNSLQAPVLIAAVARIDEFDYGGIITSNTESTEGRRGLIMDLNRWNFGASGVGLIGGEVNMTTKPYTVLTAESVTNSSHALYYNGNTQVTSSATSTFPTAATAVDIGRYRVNDGNFGAMTLQEVIVINNYNTSTVRQQIEGYLAWKWGLQGDLPAGHPYKNVAP